MSTQSGSTEVVTPAQPTTNLPSVSVFGGAHWASSPAQVCFFAMLLAMEQQMKAANAYAQYQQDIWDPAKGKNGMSMMTSMIMADYNKTIEAANDQAAATQKTAIESGCNAGLSAVSAGATASMGNEKVEAAQERVNNATGAQKEMQQVIDNSNSTQGMSNRRASAATQESNDIVGRMGGRDFAAGKPAGQEGYLSQQEKDALSVAPAEKDGHLHGQNDQLKIVKEDVKSAYDTLNAAEMDRQRQSQFISSITQMAQGASQAACRGAQSIDQANQGQDQADAQVAKMGKDNFDKMLQTDVEGNQSSKNNASQILQILVQMEKSA